MRQLSQFAIAAALLFGAVSLAGASPPKAPPGGSYQQNALAGCTNEWLFNGVWRVRVTNVAPITKAGVNYPGYAVTIQSRNGSHQTASWAYTGVADPSLVLEDGTVLAQDTDSTISWHNDYYKDLPQSAGFTHTLNFYMDSAAASPPKPAKILIEIDPKKAGTTAPHYTTATPSLRVDLTCSK
jgi:hypothetical protein